MIQAEILHRPMCTAVETRGIGVGLSDDDIENQSRYTEIRRKKKK